MEKLNITKGEAFQDGWHIMVDRKSQHTGVGYSKIIATVENAGTEEAEDNAILITNALNTYNQTPLLPSELLRQRDELIEVLNHVGSCLSETIYHKLSDLCSETLKQIENE